MFSNNKIENISLQLEFKIKKHFKLTMIFNINCKKNIFLLCFKLNITNHNAIILNHFNYIKFLFKNKFL